MSTTNHDPVRSRPVARPLLALSLAVLGCGSGSGSILPVPAPPAGEARGVPGFDTREYPGAAAMRRWRATSPYRWVGFYLPAPCYTGTSWQGQRSALREMDWGLAVLFVGEQDWPVAARSDTAAPAEPIAQPDTAASGKAAREAHAAHGERCTRDNLTAERGRADGAAAAEAARAEGFPAGTVVYLDVEGVERVSERLSGYVEAWMAALVGAGYDPGLYAHARNADALVAAAEAGAGTGVRLWVAKAGGFSLRRGPGESGFPAAIWQGRLDVDRSWGGTTLRIDENVADRPDPSG